MRRTPTIAAAFAAAVVIATIGAGPVGATNFTPDEPGPIPVIVGPYDSYDGITAVEAFSPLGTPLLAVRYVVFDLPPGVKALTAESLAAPQTVRAIVDAVLTDDPDHPTVLDPGVLSGCDVEQQADLVPATPDWLALKVGDVVSAPILGAYAASAEHLNNSCAPVASTPPVVPVVAPPLAAPPAAATPPLEPETLGLAAPDSPLVSVSDSDSVYVAAAPSMLPVTGANTGFLVMLGTSLVLLGGLAFFSARVRGFRRTGVRERVLSNLHGGLR